MNDEDQSAQNKTGGQQIAPLKAAENSPAIQPATEEQLQEAERKIETRMSAFERSMIRLTWAAVIVSVLSALVFGGQLYEMISGSTQTDKLISYAKVQANASSDQADAAQQFSDSADGIETNTEDAVMAMRRSNDINREAFVSVQRAFVIFQKLQNQKITQHLPAGDHNSWQIRVTWLNAGNTTATSTIQHFKYASLSKEPDDKLFKGGPIDSSYEFAYIGPKGAFDTGPIYMPESFFLTDPNHTIKFTDKRFFWGWVAYHDTFPHTKLHLSEFCLNLVAVGVGADKNAPSLTFNQCRHHNCVDEDCQDYKGVTDMVSRSKMPN